ncbi:MAG: hypothetical protein KA257_00920 [Opitutaceae bacterium]|nr:hypothetical protein [Opitutaceae bacterium]MBP9913226.1 hypothetical protein [Opitutaceae bacterium]
MEARGQFFAGQIEVECLLAPGGMRWSPREGEGRRNPRGGELGGGFSMRGEGERSGGMGGGRHRGGSRGGEGEASEGPRSSMHASHLPPVQLRLRLTNHGTAPAIVEVLDFNSAIGNFVVQPDKLTVPPGESVEADPMNSSLGVPADEVPLTVRLHFEGRIEKQVLVLKQMSPLPPPAVAAP